MVLLVVQEEHVAQVACCLLRVALEAEGEDDSRLANERAQVQLGRVDVIGDERVAVERSQWLADSADTSSKGGAHRVKILACEKGQKRAFNPCNAHFMHSALA